MKKILILFLWLPVFLHGQIGIRNSTASNNGSGAGSITMTIPTGTQNGDVLIMEITVRGGTSTTITTPNGWYLVNSVTSTTVLRSSVFYRVASSEPANYVVTLTSNKASGTITSVFGATVIDVPYIFAALNASGTSRNWLAIDVNKTNGDVYATVEGGDIWKQTGGVGSFNALGQTFRQWWGISVNPSNGDVYAADYGGDVYKQTGGVGSFNALGLPARGYVGIHVNPNNGDVYVAVYNGDLYKQTGGVGSFDGLGLPSRNYIDVSVNSSNGDVYLSVAQGDVYKQTGGVGSFDGLGTNRWYRGIDVNPLNGDVYTIVNNDGLYKQTGGVGSFNQIHYNGSGSNVGVAINSNDNSVFFTVQNNDIFKQIDDGKTYSAQTNNPSVLVTAPANGQFSNRSGLDFLLGGTSTGTTVTSNPTNYSLLSQGASTSAGASSRTTSAVWSREITNTNGVESIAGQFGLSAANIGHHLFITGPSPESKPRKVYIIQ